MAGGSSQSPGSMYPELWGILTILKSSKDEIDLLEKDLDFSSSTVDNRTDDRRSKDDTSYNFGNLIQDDFKHENNTSLTGSLAANENCEATTSKKTTRDCHLDSGQTRRLKLLKTMLETAIDKLEDYMKLDTEGHHEVETKYFPKVEINQGYGDGSVGNGTSGAAGIINNNLTAHDDGDLTAGGADNDADLTADDTSVMMAQHHHEAEDSFGIKLEDQMIKEKEIKVEFDDDAPQPSRHPEDESGWLQDYIKDNDDDINEIKQESLVGDSTNSVVEAGDNFAVEKDHHNQHAAAQEQQHNAVKPVKKRGRKSKKDRIMADDPPTSSEGGGKKKQRSNHMANVTFKCYICDQTFERRSILNKHVRLKHVQDSFSCRECKKSFPSYLEMHLCMKKHERQVLVPCPTCSKQINKKTLGAHMRRHTGETPYKCEICHKGFREIWEVNKHVKNKHQNMYSCYCNLCGKGFNGPVSMQLHMRSHTGEKVHTCDKCGASFSQKAHLTRHILGVHEGKKQMNNRKPMMCGKCGKSLKGAQSLKMHERLHMEVRDEVKCKICSKTFSGPNNLTRHVRVVHNGIRKIICEICNRAFADNWALRQHMPVHTGHPDVKPQQCDLCEKSFVHVRSLQAHLEKHHDIIQTKQEEPSQDHRIT